MQKLTSAQTAEALFQAGFSAPVASVTKPARRAAAKQAAKPAPKQAKAAKPAKPANAAEAAKRDAAKQAMQAQCDALRSTAARFYNGASLAAHKAKPAKLADYVSRVNLPVQKPANGNPSLRDESGLALILANAKAGAFDPVAINFDLGILSRLASVGYVTHTQAAGFTLTAPGLTRAKLVLKRAA